MQIPETLEDLESLISGQVPESIHLDYKRSEKIKQRDEIIKDISAFANSDGGMLVYGMEEKNQLPTRLDGGISNKGNVGKEWIENVITSRTNPPLPDLQIASIPADNDNSYYIVSVGKSFSGPHQAPDGRYYRRHNYKSAPMEHYEIQEVRSRKSQISPLVVTELSVGPHHMLTLSIMNPGKFTAEAIVMRSLDELPWINDEVPEPFVNGLKFLHPGRRQTYLINTLRKFNHPNYAGARHFAIEYKYYHPEMDIDITERMEFNVDDYLDMISERSDLRYIGEQLTELNKTMKAVSKTLMQISRDIVNYGRRS